MWKYLANALLSTVAFSHEPAVTASNASAPKAASPTPPQVIEGTVSAPGGVPIKAGDDVIGAIGVSGAPGDKDEAWANAGFARIQDLLKQESPASGSYIWAGFSSLLPKRELQKQAIGFDCQLRDLAGYR